jgi:hypothetical protein
MKKFLLLLIVMVAFKLTTRAQAYEGKIDYQKTQQSAAIIELPYNQDVVEDAIKDYMAKRGTKGSSSKGFNVFKGVKLDTGDTDPSDLYFKIERKSRKEKDVTVVTLIPTKANEDILSRSQTNDTRIDVGKAFLNNLVPSVDAHNLDVQVGGQQEVVKKAQKKYDRMLDDQHDLEKKIKKYQDDLEENKRDQEKQQQEVQKQQQVLDALKAKQKP